MRTTTPHDAIGRRRGGCWPSVRSVGLFTGWCYAAAMTLWFIARQAVFDQIWWLALLNTVAFFLFTPLLLLLPAALALRDRRLFAALVVPTTLFGALFGARLLPRAPAPVSPTDPTFTVMSFNVLWSNQAYDRIDQTLAQADADVVGLQEVRVADLPRIRALLERRYPYVAVHPVDTFQTVVLASRSPLEDVSLLPDAHVRRGLRATIKSGGQPIDVVVAHLAPNNMPLWPWTTFVATTQERYQTRAREVRYLAEQAVQHDRPMLVLCDCNLSETSEAYAHLRAAFQDSFAERGWGFGHTLFAYGVPVAVQRVDYVWHTAELTTFAAFVGPDGGSEKV